MRRSDAGSPATCHPRPVTFSNPIALAEVGCCVARAARPRLEAPYASSHLGSSSIVDSDVGGDGRDRRSVRHSRSGISGEVRRGFRVAYGHRSLQGMQHPVWERECGGHLACYRWGDQLGREAPGIGLAVGFRHESWSRDLRHWVEGVRRLRRRHCCHWKCGLGDKGGGRCLREVLCHEGSPPHIGPGQRVQGVMQPVQGVMECGNGRGDGKWVQGSASSPLVAPCPYRCPVSGGYRPWLTGASATMAPKPPRGSIRHLGHDTVACPCG
jgi:hypothetical protein